MINFFKKILKFSDKPINDNNPTIENTPTINKNLVQEIQQNNSNHEIEIPSYPFEVRTIEHLHNRVDKTLFDFGIFMSLNNKHKSLVKNVLKDSLNSGLLELKSQYEQKLKKLKKTELEELLKNNLIEFSELKKDQLVELCLEKVKPVENSNTIKLTTSGKEYLKVRNEIIDSEISDFYFKLFNLIKDDNSNKAISNINNYYNNVVFEKENIFSMHFLSYNIDKQFQKFILKEYNLLKVIFDEKMAKNIISLFQICCYLNVPETKFYNKIISNYNLNVEYIANRYFNYLKLSIPEKDSKDLLFTFLYFLWKKNFSDRSLYQIDERYQNIRQKSKLNYIILHCSICKDVNGYEVKIPYNNMNKNLIPPYKIGCNCTIQMDIEGYKKLRA